MSDAVRMFYLGWDPMPLVPAIAEGFDELLAEVLREQSAGTAPAPSPQAVAPAAPVDAARTASRRPRRALPEEPTEADEAVVPGADERVLLLASAVENLQHVAHDLVRLGAISQAATVRGIAEQLMPPARAGRRIAG